MLVTNTVRNTGQAGTPNGGGILAAPWHSGGTSSNKRRMDTVPKRVVTIDMKKQGVLMDQRVVHSAEGRPAVVEMESTNRPYPPRRFGCYLESFLVVR